MVTVLVVDDDDSVRRLSAMVLREEGFDVQMASNGREAIDSVTAASPDVIVLDLLMPVMTGQEFIRRATDFGWHIPILILSAYAGREPVPAGIPLIQKPFDPDDLVHEVRRLAS